MLPTKIPSGVGEDLQRRFRLSYWQSRSPPPTRNRFAIRIAAKSPSVRKSSSSTTATTARRRISPGSKTASSARARQYRPPVNPAETLESSNSNDLNALERALKHHDVACILAEPAMTNVGIILPDDGYWKSARELARRYDSLLIADETHTICAGPAAAPPNGKLDPDMLVFGKAIGSGNSRATYGCFRGSRPSTSTPAFISKTATSAA